MLLLDGSLHRWLQDRGPQLTLLENLDRICCFHHQRSVSNNNVVQWDGRRFQIPPQPQRFSFAGAKVQLYESLEGKVSIYYGENRLRLTDG